MTVSWQLVRMRAEPDPVYGECASDLDTARTMEALDRQGIGYAVNTIKEVLCGDPLGLSDQERVVPLSTITAVRQMTRQHGWVHWSDMDLLSCHKYYSYLPEWIAQRDHFFLPAYQILHRWDYLCGLIGRDGELFVRPDSNRKPFTGSVMNHKGVGQLLEGIDRDLLCVVARPQEIVREWRVFCAHGEPITGSIYWPEEERSESLPFLDLCYYKMFFSHARERGYELPELIHLDIAQIKNTGQFQYSGDNFLLMELSAVNTAGLYEMDRDKFVKTVTAQAEREYDERTKTSCD